MCIQELVKINDGRLAANELTSQFYTINVKKRFKNSSVDRKLFNNSFANLKEKDFLNNI